MNRGQRFCGDCPDHEACATGASCRQVRDVVPVITIKFRPEALTQLVRVLESIATLKVHSLGTTLTAMNLSADIVREAEQQGWER